MRAENNIERSTLNERPINTFNTVFDYLFGLPAARSEVLHTTGDPGILFIAEARNNVKDGRGCIVVLSTDTEKLKAYIYQDDWGYKTNISGTRIAHYMMPLDKWISEMK